MMRPRPIRPALPRNLSNAALSGVKAMFWLVLVAAISFGGRTALQGLPVIADAFTPEGLFAAEAKGPEPAADTAIALTTSAHASNFAPEILTPVVAHEFPDWLKGAAAANTAPLLRGSETSGDSGAASVAYFSGTPAIAIVIDDLGSDAEATRRAIHLPQAVTLSFLPYPDATPVLAREAVRAGHEILVHVPMEPEGRDDPGPNALLTDLNRDEILRRLSWSLDRVPGFSGVNNHMGSRFTADRAALIPVMETLADRHVFFLDSRTTPQSAVIATAHEFGVASAGRDVFLDDDQTAVSVNAQLALTEHIAAESGVAIAIGHPHAATLASLEIWVAHLKGVRLIPVDAAIRMRAERQILASLRQ
jgi:uncharacterized protein